MSVLALWVALSGAAFAYAAFLYTRREIRVRGRWPLAILRGAALSTVILILLNPGVPGQGVTRQGVLIVDESPSMAVVAGAELDEARVAALEDVGRGGRASTFAAGSRLAAALSGALEGGADQVTVLTDLRLADPVEVAALVRGSRAPVRFVDVGAPLRNAGVSDLAAQVGPRPGAPLSGSFTVFAEDGESPSVQVPVSLTLDGIQVFDSTVVVDAGRRARVEFVVPDPAAVTGDRGEEGDGTAVVRASAGISDDVYGDDDIRAQVVALGRTGGEVILLSSQPDWEPRFLLPALAEVTGLSVQGYLRMGPAGYLRMSGGGGLAPVAEVADALRDARVLVLQGPVPDGLGDAVPSGAPTLKLPGASQGEDRPGEWYLSAEIPASPVAAELAGVTVLGLPPLTLPAAETSVSGIPAADVQLAGRGSPVPVLYLDGAGERRTATAAARGFWRWGFRDGEGRDTYRRLWSGVAGWLLLGEDEDARGGGVGPLPAALSAGTVSVWRGGVEGGGQIRVALTREAPVSGPSPADASPAPPFVVEAALDSLGQARIVAPDDPGIYRWSVRAESADGTIREAEGRTVVEAPTLDLLHPRAVSLLDASGEAPRGDAGSSRRPLRTHPLPYVALLIFLSAEWVGRRRVGLR